MTNFIHTYSEIKKFQKKPDGFFTTFIQRPVSPLFTYLAIKLDISPNVVSVLSFLFCCISSVLIIIIDYKGIFIVAGIIWWIGAVLDSADGDLARYTGHISSFGGWVIDI